jgi:hypothetical protein
VKRNLQPEWENKLKLSMKFGSKLAKAAVIVSLMTGGVALATGGVAVAGTNGQQIEAETLYGNSIEICGHNQNNANVCAWANTPYYYNDLNGYWWKGGITVQWWSGPNRTGSTSGACFVVPTSQASNYYVIKYWT